jgi:hypothetical protein
MGSTDSTCFAINSDRFIFSSLRFCVGSQKAAQGSHMARWKLRISPKRKSEPGAGRCGSCHRRWQDRRRSRCRIAASYLASHLTRSPIFRQNRDWTLRASSFYLNKIHGSYTKDEASWQDPPEKKTLSLPPKLVCSTSMLRSMHKSTSVGDPEHCPSCRDRNSTTSDRLLIFRDGANTGQRILAF